MANMNDLSDLGGMPIHDLSDLGGTRINAASNDVQQPQQKTSYLKSLIDSDMFKSLTGQIKQVPAGFVQEVFGAGDEVRNTLAKIMNAVPGVNIPMVKSLPDSPAYNVGKAGGDILGLSGIGEGAAALRGASEAIPYIGKIASYLGKEGTGQALGRVAGTGAYGATQNPEDREKGALEGAGMAAGFEGAAKGLEQIMPKQYMNKVFDSVKDLLKQEKSSSRDQYGQVMRNFGDQEISLQGIDPELFKTQGGLKKIYEDYQEDPSIINAHKLQSQLGSADRKLKGTDVATQDRKNAYQNNRDTILGQIHETLSASDPEAAQQYASATQHYRERVVPLSMTNNAIKKVVQPTPEKIIRKMEEVTKRDAYPKAGPEGEETPLIPPEMANLQSALAAKVRNRNIAQTIGGAALGGTAAHSIGLPIYEQIAATLGGGALPKLLEKSSGKLPGAKSKSAKSSMYDPLSKALTAILLGGQ